MLRRLALAACVTMLIGPGCSNSSSLPHIPGPLGNLPPSGSLPAPTTADATVDGSTADTSAADTSAADADAAAGDAASVDVTTDVSLSDAANGPGTPCLNLCGCAQGLGCVVNQCTVVNPPQYCCGNPGCPTGSACTTLNGASGTCP